MHEQQNCFIQDTVGELKGDEVGEFEKDITTEVGEDGHMEHDMDITHDDDNTMWKRKSKSYSVNKI